MKLVNVIVEGEPGDGYSAHFELLPSAMTQGETLVELEQNVCEALELHLESMRELKMEIPEEFKGEYQLSFVMKFSEAMPLINDLKAKALAKRAGINETLLNQYINGGKKPSANQVAKLQSAIHQIGRELLSVKFADLR